MHQKKKAPRKAALVNITSTTAMELMYIDSLALERSKGGFESILVITDHFSLFAHAILTMNQPAVTTATFRHFMKIYFSTMDFRQNNIVIKVLIK